MKKPTTFRGAVIQPRGTSPTRALANGAAQRDGPARVRVGREVSGRSGKGVSVIQGLPLGTSELEALATELKKLCGAGGAVKDGVIEIQGDHRDRLVEALRKKGHDAKRAGG